MVYGIDNDLAFEYQCIGYQETHCAGLDACAGRRSGRDHVCKSAGGDGGCARDTSGGDSSGDSIYHEKGRLWRRNRDAVSGDHVGGR